MSLQEEKEKVQAQKEEVLSHMNDVLENELQCIICSEYFIEAVTLNCAHSFCSYCINEWMKRKVECPICRKDIKSKTPSLVLDNCISKMVDNLSSEVKERRTDLIKRRKESGTLVSTAHQHHHHHHHVVLRARPVLAGQGLPTSRREGPRGGT